MDHPWTVVVRDEGETQRLAQLLGGLIAPGTTVALTGPLGAGKTTFTRGLAQGLGIDGGAVTSPTFTLIHEYPGDPPLYHFDAYRLEDPREFAELGPEEYFSSPGVCVVEWGDRVRASLPPDHLEIRLEPVDDDPAGRRITFVPRGPAAGKLVAAVRAAWEGHGAHADHRA
ncbi:MAG: tRNA (adenosine(37)-N6)-threonylcarbamoyltransferase complex ATPase subunit type 1 TsaE [Limnochordales bacterium]|nr:tRNA (adenosine(37)-N6)-threonylcarbamoyltransferase complex ATPase subunit type 1 TsaE [Limnochordales bacterium]